MKKQVGVVLLEYIPAVPGKDQGSPSCYKVSQLKNTVEWSIGQVLDRHEVLALLKRSGPRAVEVIIKGLEFEG